MPEVTSAAGSEPLQISWHSNNCVANSGSSSDNSGRIFETLGHYCTSLDCSGAEGGSGSPKGGWERGGGLFTRESEPRTRMSAESPRRRSQEGARVRPQPVSDKTILESVAGFINEVVPQGYMNGQLVDGKDAILWARFETLDSTDALGDSGISGPALLLVLGYAVGVQVWLIPNAGEATEVLAWRQGVVRTLRLLPTPEPRLPHESHFAKKRPLVALCDSSAPGPHFTSVTFVSLKDGEQVKSIKFKHAVNDILVNRICVAVTFAERVAVFDAARLEESFSVTTCFPSPGLNPNPVALGARWLAYADRQLSPSVRSSGGVELEGVPSYTATVLQAAKTLGKGIREVASSLTGQKVPVTAPTSDTNTPGVVTVLDVAKGGLDPEEAVVAHFVAHAAPIVHLAFDASGSHLLTADKHGHDFHVFQLHPHPCGASLGAVHHLYVLHRGDTTAKVQDAVFSVDSRYCAVSTLRGTTHVFAVAPYGGPPSMRTHGSGVVVNRLSRFHRSAGLDDPLPCPNPRLPPYPRPTVLFPLAQLRQPLAASAANPAVQSSQRPGLGRTSSDEGMPLRVAATFGGPRAWLAGPAGALMGREREKRKSVEALFVAACHGNLIEYHLEPRPAVGREKVGDEAAIELAVAAKAQWALQRQSGSHDVQPPLSQDNLLLMSCQTSKIASRKNKENNDAWLSQVEIVTHAGPHRRLWMGPQFVFKTYTTVKGPNGTVEREAMEVGASGRPARSHPVNMPSSGIVPVLIESGSCSSYDQSPRLMDVYGDTEGDVVGVGSQLREDLAEAMLESPAGAATKDPGHQSAGRCPSIEEPPRVLITVAATLQQPRDRKAPSPPPPLDTPDEDYFEEALPGRETPPVPPTPPPEPEQDMEPEPKPEPEQIVVEAELVPPPPSLNEPLEEAPDENQEPPRGILNNSNKTKGKKAKKKKK